MMDYQFDLVGKIGSMALIRKEDKDIDYNIFSRLGAELKPGMIWVTSGATEIGRLDYLKRTGCELCGSDDEIKADYAAQGQSILMQTTGNLSIRNTACGNCWWNTRTSTTRRSASISGGC